MSTIICDLDGTLANIDHRLHFLRSKNWDGFFGAVKDDTPNQWCVELLRAMMSVGHEIIFVSGRNEIARADTIEWIENLGLYMLLDNTTLFMRPEKDFRPDFQIKEMIFNNHLLDKDILFVIEDRKQVADMWRKKDLVVLQCDEGEF